jgi:hypothetical protein
MHLQYKTHLISTLTYNLAFVATFSRYQVCIKLVQIGKLLQYTQGFDNFPLPSTLLTDASAVTIVRERNNKDLTLPTDEGWYWK